MEQLLSLLKTMPEYNTLLEAVAQGENAAVTGIGFSAELAELMARQLGSPRAIDRMTSYVYQARPRTEEMLVDEMLAICAEIETWREKKESQEAQARYNARLYYKKWEPDEEE